MKSSWKRPRPGGLQPHGSHSVGLHNSGPNYFLLFHDKPIIWPLVSTYKPIAMKDLCFLRPSLSFCCFIIFLLLNVTNKLSIGTFLFFLSLACIYSVGSVLKGLKVLWKNKLADVCCTLSRRGLHAVAVTMAFIGFSLMCFNIVTNILSAIFVVVVYPHPPLLWVAFALTSFILATLQSCSVAVALWCVCVRQKNSPVCV